MTVLTRAYRVGNSIALCERAMPAPWRRSAAGVLRDGFVHIARGAVKFPPSLVRGRTKAVGQLRDIAAGAGMIGGLLGWRYEEYRQVHGTCHPMTHPQHGRPHRRIAVTRGSAPGAVPGV